MNKMIVNRRKPLNANIGVFGAWFYNGIAGINPDPGNPGFKHIILQPQIIGDLTFAKAHYSSMYGLIKSEWEVQENIINWFISIPTNSTATVIIPSENTYKIKESGDLAEEAEGVNFLKTEKRNSVYSIGSGEYAFKWDK